MLLRRKVMVWVCEEENTCFRFKDEERGTTTSTRVFSRAVDKYLTREASLYNFSPEKISAVIFIGESLALSRLRNVETSIMW